MKTWVGRVLFFIGLVLASNLGGCSCHTSGGGSVIVSPSSTNLAFRVQPSSIRAGIPMSPAVEVEIRDDDGNLVTSANDPVTLVLLSNPGSDALQGTLQVDAIDGVAVFDDLTLVRAATGYTLEASAAQLAPAASVPFDVVADDAVRMDVSGIPPSVPGGVPQTFTVEVFDAYDNPATDYTGTVSFSSTDGVAQLPPDTAFTLADAGVRTFVDGATFRTDGTHSLSGADMADPTISGSQDDIQVTVTLPRVLGIARYADLDGDGAPGPGDRLVVPFTVEVESVGAGASDFDLPVALDALGAGAAATSGPSPEELTVALDQGARLKARQDFAAASTGANAATGVDVSGAAPDRIQSPLTGFDAVPSTPIDVFAEAVEITAPFGPADTRGLAVGDVDGDGDLDLVEALSGANRVWTNDGQRPAGYAAGAAFGASESWVVALADVDRDGDLDAIVGNGAPAPAPAGGARGGTAGSANRVWLGDGQGGFVDSGAALGDADTRALALGDLDRDGDLDLVTGNADQAVRVWIGDGQGGFTDSGAALGGGATTALVLVDMDRDGDLDLLVAREDGSGVTVMSNDGAGELAPTGTVLGPSIAQALAVADVDRDGDHDALVATDAAVELWTGDGAGGFVNSGLDLAAADSVALDLADVDSDGDLDVLTLARGAGGSRVWLGDGTGGFVDAGSLLAADDGRTLAATDLDRDGDVDCVIGQGSGLEKRLYSGSLTGVWGSASFGDSGQMLGTETTHAMALGDFDGDGDADWIAVGDGPDRVWLGAGGTFTDSGALLGTATSLDVALGDVDRDGDLDAVVAGLGNNRLWLGDGNGGFTSGGLVLGTGKNPACALGDLDRDGDLDVVLGAAGSTPEARANTVWLGDGAGGFTLSAATVGDFATADLALADLDSDGDLDLVECGSDGSRAYLGDGAGGFGPAYGSLPNARALVLFDRDRDGDLDLALGGVAGVHVVDNDGSGNLSVVTTLGAGIAFRDMVAGDVDGDGDADLFAALGVSGGSAWRGDGQGGFVLAPPFGTDTCLRGFGLADLDGDGDLDLSAVADGGLPNRVWSNQ